ncbi:glycoside hydrolase family 108 protein, partial [Sphingomonas sp. CCH13-B11]|uniref:glycoside hydrolase family 108 protein n=3 Tax=unclassified Sphingomonas TaxID=196159 RepID=UPI000A7EF45F
AGAPIEPAMSVADTNEDTIIVNAFGERFLTAAKRVLQLEGGWVNDPKDRGGETKYGISLRFLVHEGKVDFDRDGVADFDLDMDGDIDGADIRLLTRNDALNLYQRCFWKRLDADSFPVPIGEMLFDQAVNGGLLAARKMLQRAINASIDVMRPAHRFEPLKVDGVIGARTRQALDRVIEQLGRRAIVLGYRRAAENRYRAIVARYPEQRRFLRGWLARAAELGTE